MKEPEDDQIDSSESAEEERSTEEKKKKRVKKTVTKKKKSKVIVDVSCCKYDIVRECARDLGWRICEEEGSEEFNMFWTDTSVSAERVMKLQNFQKINHFPSMEQICRKVPMARNLNRMKKLYPQEYDFYPLSWILPFDYTEMQRKFSGVKPTKSLTFIVKPSAGCQGRGIYLTKNVNAIEPNENAIVQTYINKPLLIEGYKFDLRIYALVISCDPLRILLHKDGLVRLCTEKYKAPTTKNIDCSFMHLTNYAINKHNDDFVVNENEEDGSKGSKRDFEFFNAFVSRKGHDPTKLWEDISDVIIKSLLAVQPVLSHTYHTCQPAQSADNSTCFEILGFDVMIDKSFKPWLVEVNHSPSFTCDSPLDHRIKHAVILETMKLMNISADDKKQSKLREVEIMKQRLYSRMHVAAKGFETPGEGSEETMDPALKERLAFERETMEGFSLIYPTERTRKFDKLYNQDPNVVLGTSRGDVSASEGKKVSARSGGSSSTDDSTKSLKKRAGSAMARRPQPTSSASSTPVRSRSTSKTPIPAAPPKRSASTVSATATKSKSLQSGQDSNRGRVSSKPPLPLPPSLSFRQGLTMPSLSHRPVSGFDAEEGHATSIMGTQRGGGIIGFSPTTPSPRAPSSNLCPAADHHHPPPSPSPVNIVNIHRANLVGGRESPGISGISGMMGGILVSRPLSAGRPHSATTARPLSYRPPDPGDPTTNFAIQGSSMQHQTFRAGPFLAKSGSSSQLLKGATTSTSTQPAAESGVLSGSGAGIGRPRHFPISQGRAGAGAGSFLQPSDSEQLTEEEPRPVSALTGAAMQQFLLTMDQPPAPRSPRPFESIPFTSEHLTTPRSSRTSGLGHGSAANGAGFESLYPPQSFQRAPSTDPMRISGHHPSTLPLSQSPPSRPPPNSARVPPPPAAPPSSDPPDQPAAISARSRSMITKSPTKPEMVVADDSSAPYARNKFFTGGGRMGTLDLGGVSSGGLVLESVRGTEGNVNIGGLLSARRLSAAPSPSRPVTWTKVHNANSPPRDPNGSARFRNLQIPASEAISQSL